MSNDPTEPGATPGEQPVPGQPGDLPPDDSDIDNDPNLSSEERQQRKADRQAERAIQDEARRKAGGSVPETPDE